MEQENKGPAEHIIHALTSYTDHLVHNRPGIVVQDGRTQTGVRWDPVTHKDEDGQRVVYRLVGTGKRTQRVKLGVLRDDGKVYNGRLIGEYRKSGLFPEVASWFYQQVVAVWKLDNEFAARWASFAFRQEHRDLKVVLAAFLLVQSRKGDPVVDAGEVLFHDEDYRDVGEAMMLLQEKGVDLNPKLLLRIYDVLTLPTIAAVNRELGFGKSARKPFLGRWPRAVEKWLRYRENNPRMLEGLVKAGFRSTVIKLAQRVGYKPQTEAFFATLRWKQKQSTNGHRQMAIGKAVTAAESWEGLSEEEICQIIETQRPNWKRIVGLLPKKMGVTRAIMAAAIEAKSLSDKDLVILTPTLEDTGLLAIPEINRRWSMAVAKAEDMRAANVARNVRSKEVKETLEAGADKAAQKAVEEATRGLRIYVMVDTSGSMQNALDKAKPLIAKLIQSIPLDKLHVATFNTAAREVTIKHASTKGVEAAFAGISAGGGTDYGSGVRLLRKYQPKDDEDVLFIFIGDEEATVFDQYVTASGLRPIAFAFLKCVAFGGAPGWRVRTYGADRNIAVRQTAARLGIPCVMIEEQTFDDPYAIPRTLRALIAATPVGVATGGAPRRQRVTLVDQILQTKLLQKPAWA